MRLFQKCHKCPGTVLDSGHPVENKADCELSINLHSREYSKTIPLKKVKSKQQMLVCGLDSDSVA